MESSPQERQHLEAFVHEACKRSPLGVDLNVSAFVQALHSHRRPSVCTPFPSVLFTKEGDKDFPSVEAAVQRFPDIHRGSCSLSQGQAEHSEWLADLRSSLQELPLESLKLLHWLLRVRYDVQVVVDPAHELPSELSARFSGGHGRIDAGLGHFPDYVLRVQEAETRGDEVFSTFGKVKSRFGSIMAFHGTAAENLHSILRCGLLILSNSDLQRNGALFGEGIYLSTDPAVALGFCKSGKGWEHSRFGLRAKYLLLCEVAKGDKVLCSDMAKTSSPNNTSEKNLGTYIVVQNSDLVKLRYIFVYMEPLTVRVHDVTRENHPTQVPTAGLRRLDWCKLMMLFYVLLLLGIAYLKSSASKRGPRLPERRI